MPDFINPSQIQDLVFFLIKYVASATSVFWIISKIYDLGGKMPKFEVALKDISDLKEDVAYLKSDMMVVKTVLTTSMGVDSSLFTSHSPLHLQAKGLSLLKKSGFVEIFETNKELFISKIKENSHATPAEIDEASFIVLMGMKDDPLFAKFKDIAFENGIFLDVLLRVCAIYLRDALIKEFGLSEV